MRKTLVVLVLLATSACLGYERRSTLGPSTTGTSGLLGSWSSANIIPSPGACSDFKWNVTENTGTSARGTFSATCSGDLKISGTANGTLSGSGIAWNATANASAPGIASCPITLSGTAELGVDSIRVPYSGNTCLGPVSGVEVLKKN